MTTRPDLWSLGRRCHVNVDRSPVNCGYIDWTRPGDGLEIDAYILRVDEPI